MSQSHSAATLSRRLASWDWDGDFTISLEHAPSRAKLMREYLRRAAWWALELNATGEWPFFDIARQLASNVQAPPELAEELETMIHDRVGWPSLRVISKAALRWAARLDAGIPRASPGGRSL